MKIKTYDARGKGNGEVACTLTGGDESSCSHITDYTALLIEGGDELKEVKAVVRRLTPL